MSWSKWSLVGLPVAGLLLAAVVERLPAQGGARPQPGGEATAPAGPQVQVGRVLEVEAKGKQYTLKFEATDGRTFDLKLTPQVEFSVVGPGDKSFLQKGVYVTSRGVESEGKVFLSKLTIHVVPRTKRMPPGRVQKVQSVQEGESLKSYDVSGEVVAAGPAPDYPDWTALTLKVPANSPPVWLDQDVQIEVASAKPEHAVAGADLEFIARKIGSRDVPTAVRVQHPAPFTADELFGADKD